MRLVLEDVIIIVCENEGQAFLTKRCESVTGLSVAGAWSNMGSLQRAFATIIVVMGSSSSSSSAADSTVGTATSTTTPAVPQASSSSSSTTTTPTTTAMSLDAKLFCGVPPPKDDASPYAPHDGNIITPLIDGTAAFTAICKAISTAKHRVWVVVSFITLSVELPTPKGPKPFLDIMQEAATRGVDVRVLFWRPGPNHRFGSAFSGTPQDIKLYGVRHPFPLCLSSCIVVSYTHVPSKLLLAASGRLRQTFSCAGMSRQTRRTATMKSLGSLMSARQTVR